MHNKLDFMNKCCVPCEAAVAVLICFSSEEINLTLVILCTIRWWLKQDAQMDVSLSIS